MIKAIFGGTFDPPHNGHIGLASAVIGCGYVDSVILIPAFCPPHKLNKPIASFDDRLEMTKLAAEKHADICVSPIEQEMGKIPSYTFEVLEKLEADKADDDELALLIGADTLLTFHTWHKADAIAGRWKILSYPRRAFKCEIRTLEKYWEKSLACKLYSSLMRGLPIFNTASSEIRHKIAFGENVSEFLPPKVYDYIKRKNLYRLTL
jgi:nicotinate-nucleotide adenylyltransferase